MSRKAAGFGFRERIKLLRVCAGYYPSSSRYDADAAKGMLERAVERNPEEWIYWYALGDVYPDLGEIAKGVKACQRCYQLRPTDPRSTYALATALRGLAQGSRAGDQVIASIVEVAGLRTAAAQYEFWSPSKNQAALEELGLTEKEAAKGAIELFGITLQLGVSAQEREELRTSILAIRATFSELDR